jgi:hypothetical protein
VDKHCLCLKRRLGFFRLRLSGEMLSGFVALRSSSLSEEVVELKCMSQPLESDALPLCRAH